MSSLGRGAPRLLRASALAVLTALVSLSGHVLAGGALHLTLPLLIGAVALGAMAAAAADARRSFPEILAVVVLAQPVFHLLASLGGHGSHASPATGMGAGMLLAHLIGASLAAVLLSGAESALWALAGLFSPASVPTTDPTCVCAPQTPCPLHAVARSWRPRRLVASLRLRGPPVVAATA